MQLTVALFEHPVDKIAAYFHLIRFYYGTVAFGIKYVNIRNNFNSCTIFYINNMELGKEYLAMKKAK